MAVTAPGVQNPADNDTILTAWGDAVNADLTSLDALAHARSHNHSAAADGQSLSPTTLELSGVERKTGVITATVNATQNNWNPTGLATARIVRISGQTASRDITGITAQTAGTLLTLFNASTSFPIVLKSENAGSTAANRILPPAFADYTIGIYDSATLFYSGLDSRWIVLK
jgi:hypothetical protein